MNSVQTKLTIGFSTGWLYANKVYSLLWQKNILTRVGANSVEICLVRWNSNDKRMRSLKADGTFDAQTFIFRSLHLPDVNDEEPKYQLAMAKEAIARCGAAVALTHPLKVRGGGYPTGHYKNMISSGIPLAIENMDPEKNGGFNLAELERIVRTVGCRFVLDVQHAYEHDPEMKYADDLFKLMEDKLAHLHVSGKTRNNIHSLVYKATNAKKIVEFIGRVLSTKNVPLILEGEYTTINELRREIEFLTNELCPS